MSTSHRRYLSGLGWKGSLGGTARTLCTVSQSARIHFAWKEMCQLKADVNLTTHDQAPSVHFPQFRTQSAENWLVHFSRQAHQCKWHRAATHLTEVHRAC